MLSVKPTSRVRQRACGWNLKSRTLSRRFNFSSRAKPPVLDWVQVKDLAGEDVLQGYQLLEGQVPAAAPHPVLPLSHPPKPTKPVVLYRDPHAWCPYCMRIWMMLLEKGIEFESMLINLYDKPEWFSEVSKTTKTPAVYVNGEFIHESLDIMLYLEEHFPEPRLMPSDPTDAAAARDILLGNPTSILQRLFRVTIGPPASDADSDASTVAASRADALAALQELDALAAQHAEQGDFFFGEFSLVDIFLAPFLPHGRQRGDKEFEYSQFPALDRVLTALEARPSFRATANDWWTRRLVEARVMQKGVAALQPALDGEVSELRFRERREAAAKLNANHAMITKSLVRRSGLIDEGSDPHLEAHADLLEVAGQAMRRVCTFLLTGQVAAPPISAQQRAQQVAVVACLRNLVAAPRDMSSGATIETRNACDQVVKTMYLP